MYRKCTAVFILLLMTLHGEAVIYEVGTNQHYSSIADVPWATLQAGDVVQIHWRSTPYSEKWVICRQGAPGNPITVRGIPNAVGTLPVIDGNSAVTPRNLNYWGEERGLLKIGGASTPADTFPAYITIENLDLANAYAEYTFTDDRGNTQSYDNNAAALYIEKGHDITLRNCIMRSSGNGIFCGSGGGSGSNILVEGCYIYNNGNPSRYLEHNIYMEANGITVQYCRFGPLRSTADGNNLKFRASGVIVRYNWIESGSRLLDLVDSSTLCTYPNYDDTYVYGNIMIKDSAQSNSGIVHYGGDSGNTEYYRKGPLHFYNNTVVSTRSGNTTVFQLQTAEQSALVANNIFYNTDLGSRLALMTQFGQCDYQNNWLKNGYVNSHSSFSGTNSNLGGNITGSSPGFRNLNAQEFALTNGSTCIAAGTTNVPVAVAYEYAKHRRYHARATNEPSAIGGCSFSSRHAATGDDALFIHHSCGENWLNNSLASAMTAKSFVDEQNEIYYGTQFAPDSGRPAALGGTPGDRTDMNHWLYWFNDYLGRIKTHQCANGMNRIVMFKSCYPASNIGSDGTEPGDPFSSSKTITNFKAVYRHPAGSGNTYSTGGYTYEPLEDIFAANPDILFIPVTAPPRHYSASTDAEGHRARTFNNWLKTDWLTSYNAANPGLNNVVVFDWFDILAYSDTHSSHPNRLRSEYGGASGNSHPNSRANATSTYYFATCATNLLDGVWKPFNDTYLKPDFVVADLQFPTGNLLAGRAYQISVTVSNRGAVSGAAGSLGIWNNKASTTMASDQPDTLRCLNSLSPGGTCLISISNFLVQSEAGSAVLRVFVDNRCLTAESNEGNNQQTSSYSVVVPKAFSFKAFALTNNVVLRWPDPIACGMQNRTVHIRSRADDYPTNTSDGTEVYTGTNTVYHHVGCTPGQTYYYTIWLSNDGSAFVNPP